MATSVQVTFDCADPQRMMEFWSSALGYVIPPPPDGKPSWEAWLAEQGIPEEEWNSAGAVEDQDEAGPRLYFQRVPEPKSGKNRVHLDLNVGGGKSVAEEERRERVGREAARLTHLGATQVREFDERGEYWIVMQDPEGNEFCIQ